MKIGIIGSGNIGKSLAKHFAKTGHQVQLSNSRGPDSLAATVKEIGPGVEAVTVQQATAFPEVIVLAVPWTRREEAFQSAGGAKAFAGKIVIDATNPYLDYPRVEDLRGRASSEVVADLLTGARLVKAFNTIYFGTLAGSAKPGSSFKERIALPVAGDDVEAKKIVFGLIEQIGFAPVDAGQLKESKYQEPGQPLYDKDYQPAQALRELEAARKKS